LHDHCRGVSCAKANVHFANHYEEDITSSGSPIHLSNGGLQRPHATLVVFKGTKQTLLAVTIYTLHLTPNISTFSLYVNLPFGRRQIITKCENYTPWMLYSADVSYLPFGLPLATQLFVSVFRIHRGCCIPRMAHICHLGYLWRRGSLYRFFEYTMDVVFRGCLIFAIWAKSRSKPPRMLAAGDGGRNERMRLGMADGERTNASGCCEVAHAKSRCLEVQEEMP
jgi:hypothetical protein